MGVDLGVLTRKIRSVSSDVRVSRGRRPVGVQEICTHQRVEVAGRRLERRASGSFIEYDVRIEKVRGRCVEKKILQDTGIRD